MNGRLEKKLSLKRERAKGRLRLNYNRVKVRLPYFGLPIGASGLCTRELMPEQFIIKYLPGWRNHPNFSWKDHSNGHIALNFNTEERKLALEEMLGKFVERTELFMSKTDQFMRKIKTTFQNQ